MPMSLPFLVPEACDHLMAGSQLQDLPVCSSSANMQPVKVAIVIVELILVGHVENTKFIRARQFG